MQQNISLHPYNTFGIDVLAEFFIEINDTKQLSAIAAMPPPLPLLVLGGGSNILFTKNVKGIVLHNCLKGIKVIKEDANFAWIEVQAGEIWHNFVLYAIENNLGGIENLALIPGTVGAAPIQNIGAYGVEVKETIEQVTYFDWLEKKFITITNQDCYFGYRDSIFKQTLIDKVFITSVVFKLNKNPVYNTTYGAIETELKNSGIKQLSVKAIAEVVMKIRTSKLPDPKQIGNAGSFFKNPTIDMVQFLQLQTIYPQIPSYPITTTIVKIPAGWLIEQCGWKGYKNNELGIGVHAQQALVLVNYGKANGADIWQLSDDIIASVKEKFGIGMDREVNVW